MADRNSLIEIVYVRIKREISSGALMPGQRVNIQDLATRHAGSKSTVRHALNRLVGEGLLEVHTNEGFYRPMVSDESVRDDYRWFQEVLLKGLDLADEALPPPDALSPFVTTPDPVSDIEHMFGLIAGLSDNGAVVRQVKGLNDRLRPIRKHDPLLKIDPASEVAAFASAWSKADFTEVRKLIYAYHQRLLDLVPHIVALAYRPSASELRGSAR